MPKAHHAKSMLCQKRVMPKARHAKSISVYHVKTFIPYSIWATLIHKIRPQCCIYIVRYDLGRIQISFAPAARSVI